MSKGFYFSFDAFLALLVMSASLAVVSQSSSIASDPFESNTISYRQASTAGQDGMKLASEQSFQTFNDSFRQDLKDDTVMTEEDMDRTILDGVSLLWAARNISYAEEATERYFDSKLENYEYRLQVNEDGTETVLYETKGIPSEAGAVSSTSRLVSGHRIDKPSEGFQARARATEAKTNQTKVVNVPMMGSGGPNQRLYLEKKFNVSAKKIHNATLFFAAQWGTSNINSADVEINGNSLPIGDNWLYKVEKNGTGIGYDRVDITSEVQDGWNELYFNLKNQAEHHVHIHPGTRVRVKYSKENVLSPETGKEFFTDVEGQASNENKKGGVWITKPVFLPANSTVHNASLNLNVRNVRDVDGISDVEVYLDREKIEAWNLSGDQVFEVNLTDNLREGTNVLSVYVNTEVEDGEVKEFTGYPNNPIIYSDPENDPESSSYVEVNYTSPNAGLRYGKLEVVDSENVGGTDENPKEFAEDFREGVELRNAFVNLAQLDSRNVSLKAGDSSYDKVFQSPREFATPTKIGINPGVLDEADQNQFRLSDECTVKCSFLPQTSLEKRVVVPSQVGYGKLFDNQSAAVKDAEERLEDQLGQYADATSVENDLLSTGNQPYLWGPASVRLVVWRE